MTIGSQVGVIDFWLSVVSDSDMLDTILYSDSFGMNAITLCLHISFSYASSSVLSVLSLVDSLSDLERQIIA